jgi:dTDP-4-dehydrorhamnose reductase
MIWLVGDKGMLGAELAETFLRKGLDFVGTGHEMDILDEAGLAAFVAGRDLSWIVNCAAYTKVDRAEDEVEACRRLNAEGPASLASLAHRMGARLLHISSDYVFDGSVERPRREDEAVAPLGVYGRTKAEGEALALAEAPDSVILRTAWLYGRHGPNFVHTMLGLMREKEEVGVVADQRGCPTWTRDLSEAIATILGYASPRPGIYHFTDSGEASWWEFACEIERLGRETGLLKRPCRIKPLASADYPSRARRPRSSILSIKKIGESFGIRPPEWKESLAKFIEEMARGG